MTYRSEIRDSTIAALHDKVRERNYGQYLVRLTLASARGFDNQEVRFDFPVTAIIGPNGGGKTTVLGAAACAYKDTQPRQFFAKSGRYDDSMQNWAIEYELIDRSINPTSSLRRTASFRRQRWNRDAPSRATRHFGVARTVPASERAELRQCATNQFRVPDEQRVVLASGVVDAARKILGKEIDGYSEIQVDARGRITLLTGRTTGGVGYSEFHFGAGESSIIRMLQVMETAPENSLILIEEIENGLHPLATIRMVEHLIDLAERKRAQVIFTTHSNDALLPLPTDAVWVALNGRVVQGKLDVRSLRAMTGQINAQLAIFVEDEFAKAWVETALRVYPQQVALDAIQVHVMEGDGAAVKIHTSHVDNPTTSVPSLAIIDGDSRQTDDHEAGIFRLPGETPETFVFHRVLERLDDVSAKLAAAVHMPVDRQRGVIEIVRDVERTNRDPHLLFSQIGERLGLVAEVVVRNAFLSVWASEYNDELEAMIAPFKDFLPSDEPITDVVEDDDALSPALG